MSRKMSRKMSREPYRVPTAWRNKAIEVAAAMVKNHGEPFDSVTKSVVVRRIDRLIRALEFFFRRDEVVDPKGLGPFDAEDAAAIVLGKRRTAEHVVRALFGKRIADLMLDREDPIVGPINMDWLNLKGF